MPSDSAVILTVTSALFTPAATAVTKPDVLSTVATAVFVDIHAIVNPVAGEPSLLVPEAVNVSVPPTIKSLPVIAILANFNS